MSISSWLSIVLYFAPALIAIIRKHPRASLISILNIFLGWTVIVWLISLVWSLIGTWQKGKILPFALDPKKINSQKHACKCYMENLTSGEQRVADTLARELSFKDYFLFNNIIVRSKNNTSSQIDHIVVSKFGVFVIESKDYNGWIFGSENQASWTQTFPNGKKQGFQNPLRQNYSHIIALEELIPTIKNYIYSVVVFSGDAEIKTEMPPNVVYLNALIPYIKTFNTEKMSETEIQLIIGKLSYACQIVNITVEEHVKNIQIRKNIPQFLPNLQTI